MGNVTSKIIILEAQTISRKLHYFTLTSYEQFYHVLKRFFLFLPVLKRFGVLKFFSSTFYIYVTIIIVVIIIIIIFIFIIIISPHRMHSVHRIDVACCRGCS